MRGLRRHVAFSAGIALGFALGGCAHFANGMVPQAATDAPGIVVFDVDGTLTPTVPKIFWARPDAAAVARLYAERGHRIVYLTARSPLLQGTLQKFLTRNAFPKGDLVVVETQAEHKAPADFKTKILARYRTQGWHIDAAYGDSSTDFEAYARAGIPKERVFALKRVGEPFCQPGVWSVCLYGWEIHRQNLLRAQPGSPGQAAEGRQAAH